MSSRGVRVFLSVLAAIVGAGPLAAADPAPVSFHKDIRPILQANCFGCHQPAKAQGGFVMTDPAKFRAGGDSGAPAITPQDVTKSEIIARIKGLPNHSIMPPAEAKKLTSDEIAKLERWVKEGAKDDSPAAHAKYDLDHPPVYTRPPVIPALDVAPDGRLIAVAGFNEVLLHNADGGGIVARFIGLSERVESIRFSPDSKLLAVAGGLPGRMGELQIWDVAKKKLNLSVPMTADTIYGVSWSPNGKLIAFGCGDTNTVRAVDATTGKQVLFQGAHSDWVLGTVFSKDGSHVVSVSRDRSCKLTEVATERFVDNITSITPGALRGGMLAVARHPQRDEIVIGGSDGRPNVYRMNRLSVRVIGDDGNLIRELPALVGRVWSVAISPDGKRILAGSSLDGRGEIGVYSYEFDTSLPDRIKKINEKVVTSRSAEERAALEKYHKDGVRQVSKAAVPSGVYAVGFLPDGKYFAAAGSDGMVRVFETETAKLVKEWSAVPGLSQSIAMKEAAPLHWPIETTEPDQVPKGAVVESLEASPTKVNLTGPFDYAQMIVTAKLKGGQRLDVTRAVTFSSPALAQVSRGGLVHGCCDGTSVINIALGAAKTSVPVLVSNITVEPHPDFVRDVTPVLSRVGCTAGTCHGAKEGKNGFKLSLRGYDPINDVRAFTDDHASRRTSLASPDDSLMLLKCTGAVPHVGGQLTRPDEPYYRIIRDWIADGAKLNPASAKVAKIEILPTNPIVERIGDRQQFRVVASYADGSTRDVTRETFLESGNTEAVKAEKNGLTVTLRRGEAPIMARYEGTYAATTLTVMGDRTGFAWTDPPKFNKIDEFTAAKWQRMKILPSDLCGDAEFIRRVSLDLIGLPPTADAVRAFLADSRPTKIKRDELIEKLIGSPDYIEHWTNKWADLLQVNRKFLGTEGAADFRAWIRQEVADNVPYDRFAESVLTATGSNRDNPPASYFKTLRLPAETMENTTHLFLAVRFNCNKCHDHPFERWTQDQYYQTAAFFAQFALARDPASGNKTVGGTEVEGAKPLFEMVSDVSKGEVIHDRTGTVTAPKFPYPAEHVEKPTDTRRQRLAEWMTSPDNQYFAKSYVNRVWGYMLGVGIIDPIDDIRAGNPPTNPELLDYLTHEFIKSGFNVRHIHRLICKSRTYQLSVASNKWNEDDKTNCSHALARRLPAEVIYDAVQRVTGSTSHIPGLPPGTRAEQLPDSGVELPGGFLNTLGRPPRESACECERTHSLQLGPVMALVTGQVLNDAIGNPNNGLAKLVASEPDDGKVIRELYLRILNRPATDAEVAAVRKVASQMDADNESLKRQLAAKEKEWGPVFVKLQEERDVQVAQAHAALKDYKSKEYEPKRAAEEAARLQRVQKSEAALAAYDGDQKKRLPEWAAKQAKQPEWFVLKPSSIKANRKDTKFIVQPDGSIFAQGGPEATVYNLIATTELTGITGIRVEALSDDRLPGKGPGRALNGNFVLTEMTITAAPMDKPKEGKKIKLRNALADFSQANFGPEKAIDGQSRSRNDGWAVVPRTGEDHWATFETTEPLGHAGGTVLTIRLDQAYVDKMHSLGRFRISVTTAKTVGLSFPESVTNALRRAADERSEEENKILTTFLARTDEKRQKLVADLAAAKMPLPPDAKLMQLQAAVKTAEQPVPIDPKLLQLRADAKLSEEQQKNKRLTTAQDLAWALINSPAFLFNR